MPPDAGWGIDITNYMSNMLGNTYAPIMSTVNAIPYVRVILKWLIDVVDCLF